MKNEPEKYFSQTWTISDSPVRLTREKNKWNLEFYWSIRVPVDQTFVEKVLAFLQARDEVEKW